MLQLLAALSFFRFLRMSRSHATDFTITFASVITQAGDIFANFKDVLIGVVGIGLGFTMLRRIKSLFR